MKRLLLPAALVMLASCAPTQPLVQVPTLTVEQVRLTGLTLPSGTNPAMAHLTLQLRVNNPNAVPLRMANIGASLILDGVNVGKVDLPDVRLPAHGEAQQQANVQIPVTLATAGAFLQVARGQEVAYRLDGAFTADLGVLGRPTFGPFTLAQGTWQQAPLLGF